MENCHTGRVIVSHPHTLFFNFGLLVPSYSVLENSIILTSANCTVKPLLIA